MPGRPRTLLVLVGELPIADGQTPPPVVGEVGWYWLVFREVEDREPDATVGTFRAWAEPSCKGIPYTVRGFGSSGHGPARWPTVLHGDGWAASWSAPRPVLGQVELRGTLIGDLGAYSRVGVRGRVTRARVVSETIDTSNPDRSTWCPIPGEQRLREVQTAPRWFDRGFLPPPKVESLPPPEGVSVVWRPYLPVPADPCVREVGVLVELDLDDVPPVPLRPSIVPRALSACGADLWVADERLPLVVRIRERTEVTVYSWAGRILTEDEAGRRQLHADPEGCWITGPDGIHRCDQHAGVHLVDEQCVWLAAANAGVLAAVITQEPDNVPALRRIEPTGTVTDIALGNHNVTALAAAGDGGFVMMLSAAVPPGAEVERQDRLARVDGTTDLVTGPPLRPTMPQVWIGGTPTLLIDGRGLYRVHPDLTLDETRLISPQGSAPTLHGGWSHGGRLWVSMNLPDGTGSAGWWPLRESPERSEDRLYCLLIELDPVDLRPITSTLVPGVPHQVCVDGQGTVWVLGDGLHHCPAPDGATAEHLDVALLLDQDAAATP